MVEHISTFPDFIHFDGQICFGHFKSGAGRRRREEGREGGSEAGTIFLRYRIFFILMAK
jgi:hypothetical protein